eukprot:jgi/Ulvmu1/5343/UM022_0137.1
MGPISIEIALAPLEDGVFAFQFDGNQPVTELFGIVESLAGIPPSAELLLLAGKPIPMTGTIAAAGIRHGHRITVNPVYNPLGLNQDGSAVDPEAFLAELRKDADMLGRLSTGNPALQTAVTSGNAIQLQVALRARMAPPQPVPQQAPPVLGDAPMPVGDPLDPEFQMKMYEAIQQKNVMENFEHAMEHSPEVFGQVDMLYVDMVVNGEPVKAFIDSGAQSTIMSVGCAEKCRIMRLVDKRFAGVAIGVGSAKIVGRIHSCALKVGDSYISSSITVLDQRTGPQFLFGLDNLKRHQCAIDLAAGELRIGSCSSRLPFLAAHAVPQDFNVMRVQPDGAAEQLDASGSVKEAVQGDLAPLQGSGSLPSGAGAAAASAPAAAGAPTQQPPRAMAAPSAPAGNAGANPDDVQKLQDLTGRPAEECIQALQACGGNTDAAAAVLLGL